MHTIDQTKIFYKFIIDSILIKIITRLVAFKHFNLFVNTKCFVVRPHSLYNIECNNDNCEKVN